VKILDESDIPCYDGVLNGWSFLARETESALPAVEKVQEDVEWFERRM
jgi:hypothetical protein